MKIGIEVSKGKLRLRLPRSVAQGSARYISTRLDDTADNMLKVQELAARVEEDITLGRFDPTLEKYKVTQKKLEYKPVLLKDLWHSYCEFIKPQLAATTYKREYQQVYTSIINNLPTQKIGDAYAIQQHVLNTRSVRVAKRTLARLADCIDWARASGLVALTVNPFTELAQSIRLPSKYTTEHIYPFTQEERDSILKAFREHEKYSHYYFFVCFLFFTGCRTGEAIGLQWKHVSHDCKSVTFSESYNGYLHLQKDTKTGRSRKFPCNDYITKLLLTVRPKNYKPDDYVFLSVHGLPIDNHNFTERVWRRGILQPLIKARLVESYRSVYNTRHTFISLALEAGLTAPQIALLVGNSAEVIMRHYAGVTTAIRVPEL